MPWLASVLTPVRLLWVSLIAVSGAASAVLMAGGLVSRRELEGRRKHASAPPAQSCADSEGPHDGNEFALATEVRGILDRLDGLAAGALVHLELAAEPGLIVQADRLALRDIVSDVIRNAILQSSGGRVLVTLIKRGGFIQIAVVDDGAGPSRDMQDARFGIAERLAKSQGGTLDVVFQADRGTTVTLRLPEAAEAHAAGSAPDAPPHPAIIAARVSQISG